MKKITELTAELAAPAIAEQGCPLWDVEYVSLSQHIGVIAVVRFQSLT